MPVTLTTILVHGSWLGAWCWIPVEERLRELGIETVTIDLMGLGARARETSPTIGLSDHVADVVAAIDAQGHDRILLAGHSYGAFVAAGAASARADHVESLLLIDGVLAHKNRCLFDETPELEEVFKGLIDPANPGFLQPPSADFLGLDPLTFDSRRHPLTAMPLRTHEEPSNCTASDLTCHRHYIGFEDFALTPEISRQAAEAGWNIQILPGGHMSIFTDPGPTAAVLARLAGASRTPTATSS